MELKALIAECTAYDFKVMLEEKKPKSWLKSVSAFANGLGGSLLIHRMSEKMSEVCRRRNSLNINRKYSILSKSLRQLPTDSRLNPHKSCITRVFINSQKAHQAKHPKKQV